MIHIVQLDFVPFLNISNISSQNVEKIYHQHSTEWGNFSGNELKSMGGHQCILLAISVIPKTQK